MILYLRVVHSFDYYSCVEYPNEDEMPHKCGIMHARAPNPPNRLHPNESKWSWKGGERDFVIKQEKKPVCLTF